MRTIANVHSAEQASGEVYILIYDGILLCRYGPPDPNLVRDCDISVKLQMASVRYIHTNRFQMEFVAFLKHFLQLQDVLGRYRAASAGKRVNTVI
jgi:hypothetical protein